MQILAEQIADRYGNITTALIGASLGIMGGVNYLLAVKWANFNFLARALHGSGAAMVTAGALFHLVDSVPSHLKGRMMGYFGFPGCVMLAGGPLLAEAFEKYGGMRGPFVAIMVIFGSILWLVYRLPESLQRQDRPAESFAHGFRQNFFKLKEIVVFFLVLGFCFSVWRSFLAPAANDVGVGSVSSFSFGYGPAQWSRA